MRRRQELSQERLSTEELVELRKRLAGMARRELENFYKATHNACRFNGVRIPPPRLIQEFVQAWRELRRLRG